MPFDSLAAQDLRYSGCQKGALIGPGEIAILPVDARCTDPSSVGNGAVRGVRDPVDESAPNGDGLRSDPVLEVFNPEVAVRGSRRL